MKAADALRYPWYPFLVAAVPPLFVWSVAAASVDPADALAQGAFGAARAGGALVLLRRRLGPERAGLGAALTVVGLVWPPHPVVALLCPVLGLPLLLRVRPTRDATGFGMLTVYLNGLSLTTVAVSLAAVVLYASSEVPSPPVPKPVPFERDGRPDVWCIVLDGLSRGDWLERRFYVEDLLEPGLERRGFQVARAARATYPQTLYAVAPALSLDSVPSTAGRREVSRGDVQLLVGANVVAASFRTAGSTVRAASTGSTRVWPRPSRRPSFRRSST